MCVCVLVYTHINYNADLFIVVRFLYSAYVSFVGGGGALVGVGVGVTLVLHMML